MNRLFKPALCLLLAAAMTCTSFPVPAWAGNHLFDGGEVAEAPERNFTGQTACRGDAESCTAKNPKISVPADPIYLDRGEFVYRNTDLTLPGRGINLELKRVYRSNSAYHSQFGFGWDINYNLKVRKMADGSLTLLTGTNRKENVANGQSPPGFYDSLVEETNGTFTLTKKHGDKAFFDVNGNLIRMEDRFGNYLTLTYDPQGKLPLIGPSEFFINQTEGVVAMEYRLTRAEDALGRFFNYFYDSRGRLDHVTDSAGRTVQYTYDSNNDLIAVTTPPTPEYPQGLTTQFTYQSDHRLLTVTDPKGQTYVTNVYNSDGKIDSQTLLNHGTTTSEYDPNTGDVTITDRKGFITLWKFDADGRPVERRVQTAGFHQNEPPEYVTQFFYDANGELIKTILPRGNIIENVYNLDNGNLLETHRKPIPGNQDPPLTTLFTYDPTFNLIKSVTDPNGNVTSYFYDFDLGQGNQGKLLRIDFPQVNGGTPQTHFTYNAFGQVETVQDPNGHVTQYTYNAQTGYLETITQGFGTPQTATTTLTYDAYGNIASLKNANNHTTSFLYNALAQLTQVTSPAPFNFLTKYMYDENGNLKQVDRQMDTQGQVFQITQYAYTELDQLETIIDHAGNVTAFEYDNNGNRKAIIDAELRRTDYVYDERNLLTTVDDAAPNGTTARYDYDANGNLSRVVDANTNETQYVYDDFDRLKQTQYADLSTESYSYDAASNLTQKTNADGEVITYDYDALNRLTDKHYVSCDPSVCGGDVTYTYDLGSRLTQAANNNATLDYLYDPLNRMTKETTTVNGTSYSVLSQYDKTGNRKTLKYPHHQTNLKTGFAYYYDSLNRLTGIGSGLAYIGINDPFANPHLYFEFIYDPLSRRTELRRKTSNLNTVYSYDDINRLTAINHGSLGSIQYPQYDKLGNRKHEINQITQNNFFDYTYDYDEIYELTGVRDQNQEIQFEYDYDPTGNRLTSTENGEQSTYVPNNLNQYDFVNGTDYAYDLNGNLTDDGTNTYVYDFENHLISVDNGQSIVNYTYDPLGRRSTKYDVRSTTLYIHDQDHIIEDYTCDPNFSACVLVRSYLYSNRIDELLQVTSHTAQVTSYYVHHDALGNTIAITDKDRNLIETYQYDPYGNPHFFDANGEPMTESQIGNQYLYTGREDDREANLQHSRNRTYFYDLGRFGQRDPYTWAPNDIRIIGTNVSLPMPIPELVVSDNKITMIGSAFPQLQQPYAYVLNSPLNGKDPTGKLSIVEVLALIAVLFAAQQFYKYCECIDYSQEAAKKALELSQKYPNDPGKAMTELRSSEEFKRSIQACGESVAGSYTTP